VRHQWPLIQAFVEVVPGNIGCFAVLWAKGEEKHGCLQWKAISILQTVEAQGIVARY
jgi:hypothetical protein